MCMYFVTYSKPKSRKVRCPGLNWKGSHLLKAVALSTSASLLGQNQDSDAWGEGTWMDALRTLDSGVSAKPCS